VDKWKIITWRYEEGDDEESDEEMESEPVQEKEPT
jgi:hypothetical protein